MGQTTRPLFEVIAFESLGDRNTITPRPRIDTIQGSRRAIRLLNEPYLRTAPSRCSIRGQQASQSGYEYSGSNDSGRLSRSSFLFVNAIIERYRVCLTAADQLIGLFAYHLLSQPPQNQQYLDLLESFKIVIISKQNNVSREHLH